MTEKQKTIWINLFTLVTLEATKKFIPELFGADLETIRKKYFSDNDLFFQTCFTPENELRFKQISNGLLKMSKPEPNEPDASKLSKEERRQLFKQVFKKVFIEGDYVVGDITKILMSPYTKSGGGGIDAVFEEFMVGFKKEHPKMEGLDKKMLDVLIEVFDVKNMVANQYEALPLFANFQNREVISKDDYLELVMGIFEDMKNALTA